MMKRKSYLLLWSLLFVVLSFNQTATANLTAFQISAAKYYRTELYFGMNKGGDAMVSDEDWDRFLETEVTPRFPQGFTVFEGFGQYRNSSNKIVREPSRVLLIFYERKERQSVNQKVEEIRDAYKKQFAQESVLRLDFTKPIEVSF